MTTQPTRKALMQKIAALEAALEERRGHDETNCTEETFSLKVIEHAADGICVCHAIDVFPFVRFTFWNQAMVDLSGYDLETINRLGWYQSVYPDPEVQARAIARMSVMREGVDIQAEEWEITRADGRKRTLRISTAVLAHDNDRPQVMAIMHDVTERRRAEEALDRRRKELEAKLNLADRALQFSDAKYHTLFMNAGDAIFIHDLDGRIIDANQNALGMLGYSKSEISALKIAALHPQNALEKSRWAFETILREGHVRFETDLINKQGEVIPAEVSSNLFEIGGNQVIQGIVRDIRERKAVERARREAYDIIAQSPVVVFLWQNVADWPVEYVSPNVDRIFGYSAQDFINGRVVYRSVVHAEDLDRVAHEVTTYSQEPDREEFTHEPYRIVGRDGAIRWVSDRTFIRRNPQGVITHYQGILEDVTERRRIDKEMLKMEKLQSLGVLAGGIAHDFNNFLTGIIGNLSLAKLEIRPNDPVARTLNEMAKAAARAKDLTQQLLTFSKGGEPVKRTARIGELVREAAQFALRGSNVRCDLQIDADLRPSEIDEGQIAQVLHNLMINADQAMPDGGAVRIGGTNVTLPPDNPYALAAGDFIQLTIQDQGLGIKPEHLKKVFDPYFTTKQKGSGLGLAVTYSIVAKHDGQLTVDSKLGEGTVFTILLPAADSAAVVAHRVHPQLVIGSGRILVMDDEVFIRDLATRMLQKMGYTVTVAEDGRTAVAMYREALEADRAFDAVILDLTVPGGMGGKATVRALQTIDPDVSALVSSGYSNDPVMASYQDYGFCGAVKKPYLIQEMGNLLKKVIGG